MTQGEQRVTDDGTVSQKIVPVHKSRALELEKLIKMRSLLMLLVRHVCFLLSNVKIFAPKKVYRWYMNRKKLRNP